MARKCQHNLIFLDLPPNPVTRFVVGYACALRGRGNGDGDCEVGPTPYPRYSLRFVVGYACAYEEGGTASGFARGLMRDFNRFMPSVNTISATLDISHQRCFTPLSS